MENSKFEVVNNSNDLHHFLAQHWTYEDNQKMETV